VYLSLPRTIGIEINMNLFNALEQFVYDILSNNSRRWGMFFLEEHLHGDRTKIIL